MSPPPDGVTEKYADPTAQRLSQSRRQRVAVLSWTDSLGSHEVTIDGPTTVGSEPNPLVVVADPSVSRVHVELTPGEEGLTIRDLKSTNGTFVDTMRIVEVVSLDDVRLRLGRVEVRVRLPSETVEAALWPRASFGRLLGTSVVMRGMFEQLSRIAPTGVTVMLHGETGTGKELVAEAIHQHSKRRAFDFLVLDCGALSGTLLESELFGHARGAFTGAHEARQGIFEAASGGTVFLDEIGELPLEMQSKLLRVLESGTIRRLGETEYRKVDVRVISASHRDLRELVNRRAFREDLFFRLAVIPVRVPPLRDRAEDIPMLVDHFLEGQGGEPVASSEVKRRLMALPWTGNVRELRNEVARASILGWEQTLAMAEGSEAARPSVAPAAPAAKATVNPGVTGLGYYVMRDRWVEAGERAYIPPLLARHQGNIMEAAIEAGLHNSYLRKLMKKRGIGVGT